MKKLSCIIAFTASALFSHAQNVGVGTNSPHSSAALDVSSTSKGMLVPRMTSAQRSAISSPANGLLVFDTDTGSFWFYNNSSWSNLVGGAGNSGWTLSGNHLTNTNTGFVGIGTSNPYSPFTVTANSHGITQQTSDGGIKVGFYTGTTGAYVQTITSHPLKFAVGNGGEQMTLALNGFLGLGTNAPTAKLHVNGNALVQGSLNVQNTLQVQGNLQILSGTPGLGKVFTSDDLGIGSWKTINAAPPKIGFHVRGVAPGGANILVPNVYNKVHFNNQTTDYGDDYRGIAETPSSSFIVPVNGFYHLSANINFNDFAGGNAQSNYYKTIGIRIMLQRGGTIRSILSNLRNVAGDPDNSEDHMAAIQTDARLLAGDIIWIEIFHTNRDNMNTALFLSDEYASFSGHIIFQD